MSCHISLYNYVLSAALTVIVLFFFFNDTAPTEIYTLSLHDALPISSSSTSAAAPTSTRRRPGRGRGKRDRVTRSEEHTSELQSRPHLVCRLLLEKKKKKRALLSLPRSEFFDS